MLPSREQEPPCQSVNQNVTRRRPARGSSSDTTMAGHEVARGRRPAVKRELPCFKEAVTVESRVAQEEHGLVSDHDAHSWRRSQRKALKVLGQAGEQPAHSELLCALHDTCHVPYDAEAHLPRLMHLASRVLALQDVCETPALLDSEQSDAEHSDGNESAERLDAGASVIASSPPPLPPEAAAIALLEVGRRRPRKDPCPVRSVMARREVSRSRIEVTAPSCAALPAAVEVPDALVTAQLLLGNDLADILADVLQPSTPPRATKAAPAPETECSYLVGMPERRQPRKQRAPLRSL